VSEYVELTGKPHVRKHGWCNEYVFWCPGCEEPHSFRTDQNPIVHPNWTFNGNIKLPTFSPSLLYPKKPVRCHLNVTDGNIKYHNDCQHKLAGATIDMVSMP
jgi:hypothetical protein